MQQKMGASNVLTQCDEEGSTSGTTQSNHGKVPYKPSLPSISSRSNLPLPAYSTLQCLSFAPVFINKGTANFTMNISPSGVINHTKDKDDFDCDNLLDGIQLETCYNKFIYCHYLVQHFS